MLAAPTHFDTRFMEVMARFLGRHPLFDLSIQSSIRHNLLGGFWFAACLFVFWVKSARPGQQQTRISILTTMFGSGAAILLAAASSLIISWPPPYHSPGLADIYIKYFDNNPNTNSFPSFSSAAYAAIAAGLYPLNKIIGSVLWLAVGFLVALPRMYVGGHYPSDVIAGFVLGIAGFFSAHCLLEPCLVVPLEQVLDKSKRLRLVREVFVFAWIVQIAVEFREIIWLKNSITYLLR